MPKRKLLITRSLVLVFAVLVLLSSVCYSYQVPDDTIVYVTPTGEKYHREDCTYTGSVRRMTIAEAERRGYYPCSRCDPDFKTGKYVSTWDGQNGGDGGDGGDSASKPASSSNGDPWYSSPWSAILVIAAVGALTKVVITLVISLRPFHFSCSHFHRVQMQQLADC